METEPLGKDYKEMLSTHLLEKDYLKLDRLCVCGLKIKLSVSSGVCKEIQLFSFCAHEMFSKEGHLILIWAGHVVC